MKLKLVGCLLAVCVGMLPLAAAVTLPFQVFTFTVEYQRLIRVAGHLGYIWHAEGFTDEGLPMEWTERGVFTFERPLHPLGCGLTVANGFIDGLAFQFGTAAEPYHWCSSSEGALLEGNFYLNNEFIGYCEIWNPTDHMEMLGCT